MKFLCLAVRYKVNIGEALRFLDKATIGRIGGKQETVINGRQGSTWTVFRDEIRTELKSQVMVSVFNPYLKAGSVFVIV